MAGHRAGDLTAPGVAGGQCQPVPRRRLCGHGPHRLCCGHQRQRHQQPGLWARRAGHRARRARAGFDAGQRRFHRHGVERRTRRAYTVENRHKTPVTLQVLHAAPQSRNEKIEVESALPTPAHRPGLEPQPRHRGLAAAWLPGPPRSSAQNTPSATPKTWTRRNANDL